MEGKEQIHIKIWQLMVATAMLLIVMISGWVAINLQVKELQVNQINNFKKIELNTKKIELLYDRQIENQMEIRQDLYDIKLLLKDKQDKV